jgi:hypothetical protein
VFKNKKPWLDGETDLVEVAERLKLLEQEYEVLECEKQLYYGES